MRMENNRGRKMDKGKKGGGGNNKQRYKMRNSNIKKKKKTDTVLPEGSACPEGTSHTTDVAVSREVVS